ncbi:MAG: hypothetical protein ACLRWM_10265 [Streptococcus sp.]
MFIIAHAQDTLVMIMMRVNLTEKMIILFESFCKYRVIRRIKYATEKYKTNILSISDFMGRQWAKQAGADDRALTVADLPKV